MINNSDKVKFEQSFLLSVANMNLLVETSMSGWREITEKHCNHIDSTLQHLKNDHKIENRINLFSVTEEPEYSVNTSFNNITDNHYKNDETMLLKKSVNFLLIDPKQSNPYIQKEQCSSEIFRRISAIKTDKIKDEQSIQALNEFLEKSTIDDLCVEAHIIQEEQQDDINNLFDDSHHDFNQIHKQKSHRKSIIAYVQKQPNELIKNQIDLHEDQNIVHLSNLEQFRNEFNKERNILRIDQRFEQENDQYSLTDYNTNESSNLDEYSYQWKESESQQDQQLINISNEQYSVKQQNSPKKKKLYCNNKRVPEWAQDLENSWNQIIPINTFKENVKIVNHSELFPGLKNQPRGSSAQWQRKSDKKVMCDQFLAVELMKQLHEENLNQFKQPVKSQQLSMQKSGMKKKIIGLINSVKKIWTGSEQKDR